MRGVVQSGFHACSPSLKLSRGVARNARNNSRVPCLGAGWWTCDNIQYPSTCWNRVTTEIWGRVRWHCTHGLNGAGVWRIILTRLGHVARDDILQRTDIATPINYRKRRHELFGQHDGRCGDADTNSPFRKFTVDHVIPRSRGGTDHLDNLQLLCGACNSFKGDRTQEYLLARLSERAARLQRMQGPETNMGHPDDLARMYPR